MKGFGSTRTLSRHSRAGVGLAAVGLVAALVTAPQTATAGTAQADGGPRLTGFTRAHSATELAAEKAFKKVPSTTVARRLDGYLSRKTGLLGTQGDWRRVQYVVRKLRSYGLTPHVETVYPYMSVPKHISLVMTAPKRHVARTNEKCRAVETDCKDVVVGYNALSPSGDVKGQVVYVNYGTTEDYQVLARKGVSVKGKIVLARYGKVFRGVKTNLAAEHGAKGVLLYSDPADDGYTKGAVYPSGPWRAPDGIQRGSIQELWLYGGDPLTPGWKATKYAKRINPKRSNIGKIPTTPIGYGSAKPMLKALRGPKAPKSWQGGLPFTYRNGAGPTRVHMKLDIAYKVKPIWNVTATIRGAVHPHQVVYLGAHRDTWTYGSDDNLSGAETVMQIGRGLGKLLKSGWRPDRTIKLATWDGEEYGLFGSTEHAEGQGQSRLDHVVAYVNMDGAAGQDFGASAVPSLDRLVFDTTKSVQWPHTGGTIYADWAAKSGGSPTVARLGSGSDYTAYLDHFGVPAVDIGASTPSGDYHCACDNNYMERTFIDPGWHYHVAMAKEAGIVTMRLAGSDAVLLRYRSYANEVGTYLQEFAKAQRTAYGRQVVDISRDLRQAKLWAQAAAAEQARQRTLLQSGRTGPLQDMNRRLMAVERDLLTRSGLPGRPWYRHQIYAPGVNQGYGTQELPGLHDALFLHHNPAQAKRYEAKLFASLRAATATLRKA
jgi:N-acetylated-alpha-linked acidic dipeptidase